MKGRKGADMGFQEPRSVILLQLKATEKNNSHSISLYSAGKLKFYSVSHARQTETEGPTP